jgi:predicted short-subunit dehydrogenase-like oxidoreductase (DUF2520 family)
MPPRIDRRSSKRRRGAAPSVFVLGAGKAGTALARALRARGAAAQLRPARKGLPRAIDADVVILAVRDRDLAPLAQKMREAAVVPERAVVLHVAGALGAEPLAALRGACAGVGQMHPMISFATRRWAPDIARGNVHVQGDPRAVARARSLARLLGMTPRTVPHLDPIAYHAAAGLVANGAAALAAVGAELLVRAGVAREIAPKMLGPLLRSVAENVERLGFPEALTGPVRRGDVSGLEKHLSTLRAKLPEAVGLYLAAARAQLPLARAIAEAPAASFDAIESSLAAATSS